MKKLFVLLFLVGTAYAQNTVVSATMIDSSGQIYANGTWKVDFFPTPNTPGPFTQQGSSFTQHFNGSLTSNGSFTVTVADNSTIVPAGSKWTFTVCPNATFQCTSTNQTITGAAIDLSPIINALLPPSLQDINPFPNFAAAYKNLSIGPPYKLTDGSTYFNTTTGKPCWFYQGIWECASVGGAIGIQSINGDPTPNQIIQGIDIGVITSGGVTTIIGSPPGIVTINNENNNAQFIQGGTGIGVTSANGVHTISLLARNAASGQELNATTGTSGLFAIWQTGTTCSTTTTKGNLCTSTFNIPNNPFHNSFIVVCSPGLISNGRPILAGVGPSAVKPTNQILVGIETNDTVVSSYSFLSCYAFGT